MKHNLLCPNCEKVNREDTFTCTCGYSFLSGKIVSTAATGSLSGPELPEMARFRFEFISLSALISIYVLSAFFLARVWPQGPRPSSNWFLEIADSMGKSILSPIVCGLCGFSALIAFSLASCKPNLPLLRRLEIALVVAIAVDCLIVTTFFYIFKGFRL
jgi:hypothetical protein